MESATDDQAKHVNKSAKKKLVTTFQVEPPPQSQHSANFIRHKSCKSGYINF